MDKNNFESYEYFPYNGTINHAEVQSAEQIYVVQEDDTYLVTENVKEAITADVNQCAMYLPPQQFFVDIQTSPDLIIADHSTQSNNDNIFTNNSYLIQPATNQPHKEEVDEETSEHETLTCSNSNLENTLTEVTITDEQYLMLQQKGWVLLETTDKVHLLDNLGLHNITNNENLIQKLKNEIESFKVQSQNEVSDTELSNTKIKANSTVNKRTISEITPAIKKESDTSNVKSTELDFKVTRQGDHNIIKIKSNLKTKDFPDKILLGKTKTGKKLFAKFSTPSLAKPTKKTSVDNVGLPKWQIQNRIRQLLEAKKFQNESDVNAVKATLMELLKMSPYKPILLKSNLFVTRVVKNLDTIEPLDESKFAIITGRIVTKSGHHSFLHMPNMIRDLVADISGMQGSSENCNNLHVHLICEAKKGNESRVSVNISKLDLSHFLLENKKKSKTMFACGICAKLFTSEIDLKDHQETQCAENDDALTIDTDKITNYNMAYYTTENNGTKYVCLRCDASFNRLTNCHRHIRSHSNTAHSSNNTNSTDTSNSKNDKIYRCEMCSASYNHPSTLAKHIVTMHVKV